MNSQNLSHKTQEEKKWISEYFNFKGGCLKKPLTRTEYIDAVMKRAESLNLKKAALSKIGLDEDQVNEIAPIKFEGFNFLKSKYKTSDTASAYTVTWLFFSSSQIYFYSYTFDMTSSTKDVKTEEYFYKDVTNFSSSNETVEVIIYDSKGCIQKQLVPRKGQIDTANFSIVVPGEKLSVPMKSSDENKIQAMKQKLREKKN